MSTQDSEMRLIGYMLIELAEVPDFLEIGRPKGLVLAPTPCICKFHPSHQALAWSVSNVDDRYIDSLNLDIEKALGLQENLDFLCSSQLWGWDGVFTDLSTALTFKENYFSTRSDVILTGLAVVGHDLEDCINSSRPPQEFVSLGMHWCASKNLPAPSTRITLGFESISINGFGDTHTSMCYGVRPEYIYNFEVAFNEYGFMTSLSAARAGAKANMEAFVADAAWFGVEVFLPSIPTLDSSQFYEVHALK